MGPKLSVIHSEHSDYGWEQVHEMLHTFQAQVMFTTISLNQTVAF